MSTGPRSLMKLCPDLGQAQALPNNGGETENYPSVVMTCPRCGNPMTLRTKKDGKGFYIGCSAYPNCKASIWLPDFVLQVHVTDEPCHVCQPGPVKKLQFTFRPGNVPVSIPNIYTGCVAGCNEMLNETLGIRPFSGPGNGAQVSRTGVTVISPRNNSSGRGSSSNTSNSGGSSSNTSNSGGRGGGAVQFNGANCLGTNSTRGFHTTATDTGNRNRGLQGGVRPSFNIHQNVGVVPSFNSRVNPQSTSFPRTFNSLSGRSPLNSIDSGMHNSRSTFSSPSVDRNGSTSSNGKDIVCSCGTDALLLTVRKEGPNTGRQFYKCSGHNGTNCNFFLWADENEPQQRGSSSSSNTREMNSRNSFPQPQSQSRPGSTSSTSQVDEVQCRCGLPAKYLTVQKQGPNHGRQFYGCSKPRDQSCNFFQWADETSSGSGSQAFPERGATNGLGLAPFQPNIGMVPKRKRSAASETEGGPKQRKAPTCGLCGQPGHKRPKCPERSDRF